MKTKINLLLFIILFTAKLFSQTWDVYLGGPTTYEAGRYVYETYDKGYIFLSNEDIFLSSEDTMVITKLNVNGEILWQKSIGHDDTFTPQKIIEHDPVFIKEIGLEEHLSPNRANGLVSMLNKIKAIAKTYINSI